MNLLCSKCPTPINPFRPVSIQIQINSSRWSTVHKNYSFQLHFTINVNPDTIYLYNALLSMSKPYTLYLYNASVPMSNRTWSIKALLSMPNWTKSIRAILSMPNWTRSIRALLSMSKRTQTRSITALLSMSDWTRSIRALLSMSKRTWTQSIRAILSMSNQARSIRALLSMLNQTQSIWTNYQSIFQDGFSGRFLFAKNKKQLLSQGNCLRSLFQLNVFWVLSYKLS